MTRGQTVSSFRKIFLTSIIIYTCCLFQFSFAQTQKVFAIIGDFGYTSNGELNVANMVKGWSPDDILTVGDNIYETKTTDYSVAVGNYYHEYMYPVDPNYSSDTQTSNHFWPVVGNHDWAVGSNLTPYLNYFKMVNNKRYYSFTIGDVEFFAIDSDTDEPDGTSSGSKQYQWLQQALTGSTALWKIVLFHHPAYCSGGSSGYMQWPFKTWGADAVMSGHIHFYERISMNGLLYFVNGLGGASIKSFSSAIDSSQAHYDTNLGAMKITESIVNSSSKLLFEFYSLGNNLQDSTSLQKAIPLPIELSTFNAKVIGNSSVELDWSTATEVNNYGFDVERSNASNDWQKIGFVAGSGNSNSPKNYSFVDYPSGGSSFSYRLKQIDVGGSFKYYDAVSVKLSAISGPQLLQNNPNPFNPSTAIKFYVPDVSNVTIKIYDILGREVKTLLNEQTGAGYHVVYWNGRDSRGKEVSSGIYLYMLRTDNFIETKKMNLMK